MTTKMKLMEFLEVLDDDEEFIIVAGTEMEEGDVLVLVEINNISNGLTRQLIVGHED